MATPSHKLPIEYESMPFSDQHEIINTIIHNILYNILLLKIKTLKIPLNQLEINNALYLQSNWYLQSIPGVQKRTERYLTFAKWIKTWKNRFSLYWYWKTVLVNFSKFNWSFAFSEMLDGTYIYHNNHKNFVSNFSRLFFPEWLHDRAI